MVQSGITGNNLTIRNKIIFRETGLNKFIMDIEAVVY